jgi:hypothetical protein
MYDALMYNLLTSACFLATPNFLEQVVKAFSLVNLEPKPVPMPAVQPAPLLHVANAPAVNTDVKTDKPGPYPFTAKANQPCNHCKLGVGNVEQVNPKQQLFRCTRAECLFHHLWYPPAAANVVPSAAP